MADYTIEERDKCLHVTLAGDLTAGMVAGLQNAIRQALQPSAVEITIDLVNTAMLDSSGIGLLIATYNSLSRRQGRLKVVNASTEILQMLESMRLVNRLNVTGRTTTEVSRG